MQIIDLRPRDRALVARVACLLVDGCREQEPGAFPGLRIALAEARALFGPERQKLGVAVAGDA